MTVRFKIYFTCFCMLILVSTSRADGQLLQDTTSLRLVKKDIGYIYNLQFEKANKVHSDISKLYPNHPVVFLLNGLMTYWKNYPMLSISSSRDSFEADMRQCIALCENKKDTPYEAEYLLADLCARGMLLMFYADNDLVMEVIPLTTNTYRHVRRSFDLVSFSSDLNYFAGVYNYYVEAYPEAYPVYKPVSLLFPGGNKGVGLKQLKTAALNSVVLQAESFFLLNYIYINFENSFPEAVFYSKSLYELYPDNRQYQALYIKSLLLVRSYDQAERLIIDSFDETDNRYFKAQLTIFRGILQEKKYLDYKLALEYYKKGIRDISGYGGYGNEYAAYAYYGLSRIGVANGDRYSGKIYRKEAMKLADFKEINFDK